MSDVSMIDGHIDEPKTTGNYNYTDNEIISGLECCLKSQDAPISHWHGGLLSTRFIKDTLDLIKRQKEQINGLIAGQETLQRYISEIKKEDIL